MMAKSAHRASMRSLLLALVLAPARAVAQKTRTAPRDAAAAFFHNPAATVLHETEAFEAAALPTVLLQELD